MRHTQSTSVGPRGPRSSSSLDGALFTLRALAHANAPDAVQQFDARLIDIADTLPPHARGAVKPFVVRTGKRIRPHLVMTVSALSSADTQSVASFALAVELVHLASLFHDDIVDHARVRRSQPTIAAVLGPSAAVLAGAWLFHTAVALVQQIRLPHARRQQRLRECLARTAVTIALGQLEETVKLHKPLSEREYLRIISRKTGRLFQASCEGAGMVAGIPIGPLSRFGRNLGLLYQIVDDLRDIVCTEAELGKPPGSDLRAGLFTLPVIYACEASAESAERMQALVGRAAPVKVDTAAVIAALNDARAFERVLERARVFAGRASSAIREYGSGEIVSGLEAVAFGLLEHTESIVRRAEVQA